MNPFSSPKRVLLCIGAFSGQVGEIFCSVFCRGDHLVSGKNAAAVGGLTSPVSAARERKALEAMSRR